VSACDATVEDIAFYGWSEDQLDEQRSPQRGFALFALLAPAITKVGRTIQPQADLRVARFAVAMEQARRRSGSDAPELDALAPAMRAITADALTERPVTRAVDGPTGMVRYGVRLSGEGAFGEGSPILERARPQEHTLGDTPEPAVDWLWLELRPAQGQ